MAELWIGELGEPLPLRKAAGLAAGQEDLQACSPGALDAPAPYSVFGSI